MNRLPILYSFRRCPYAIRARLAIKVSNIQVELREVKLAAKPQEMLACSVKGTVPVIHLPDGSVIDESRDIMMWALEQHDPYSWLPTNSETQHETARLIDINDNEFKEYLDHYKYADRHPEQSMNFYREQCEAFLKKLEDKLIQRNYLISDNITFADIAIFPFIRQFAYVDKDWFDKTSYINVQSWLNNILETQLFHSVMNKLPSWSAEQEATLF